MRGAVGRLVREYVGMDDTDTARDIEQARQDFETRVTEPDPNNARRAQRKVGSVTAWKKGTHVVAGSLSFGVTEDEQGDLIVRTTQFSTQPEFEGKHVALLLAYDLRDHYGVNALRSTSMEPTDGGAGVIASLRRRGIMSPAESND